MGQTDARKKRKLGEATSAPQNTTDSQQPAPQNTTSPAPHTTSPAPHTTSHNKKSNNSAKKKRKKRTGGAAEEESQLPDGSSFKIDGATATPEQLSLRIRYLVKSMKPPVHIAALSMSFAKQVGCSIKKFHKRGGMLNFVHSHMADELLVVGEGNDSFVQLNNERHQTRHWLMNTIHQHGPILVSMVGRMYHEHHGKHFGDVWSEGVHKFLCHNLENQVTLTASKGNEMVVDVTNKEDPRFFVGKKKRRKTADDEAAQAHQSCLRERSADNGLPYKSTDRILVVGDADLSWSTSLVQSWGAAAPHLLATTYEPKSELFEKYGKSCVKDNRRILQAAGATVMHSVDGTKLTEETLKGETELPFDFVVFNFPHTGTDEGLASSIEQNRKMMKAFLASCPPILDPKGTSEVHVALVHRYPYSAWKVAELVPDELKHVDMIPFNASLYPHYQHRKTSLAGVQTSVGLEGEPCVVHAFALKIEKTPSKKELKKQLLLKELKELEEESSSDEEEQQPKKASPAVKAKKKKKSSSGQ